eukprot:71779_1
MDIFKIPRDQIAINDSFSVYQFIKNHQFEAYRNRSRIRVEKFEDSYDTHYLFCTLFIDKEIRIKFDESLKQLNSQLPNVPKNYVCKNCNCYGIHWIMNCNKTPKMSKQIPDNVIGNNNNNNNNNNMNDGNNEPQQVMRDIVQTFTISSFDKMNK